MQRWNCEHLRVSAWLMPRAITEKQLQNNNCSLEKIRKLPNTKWELVQLSQYCLLYQPAAEFCAVFSSSPAWRCHGFSQGPSAHKACSLQLYKWFIKLQNSCHQFSLGAWPPINLVPAPMPALSMTIFGGWEVLIVWVALSPASNHAKQNMDGKPKTLERQLYSYSLPSSSASMSNSKGCGLECHKIPIFSLQTNVHHLNENKATRKEKEYSSRQTSSLTGKYICELVRRSQYCSHRDH